MPANKAGTRVGWHINNLISGTPLYKDSKSWLDVGCGNGIACTMLDFNYDIPHKVGVDVKAWESGPDWVLHRTAYDENCPVWNEKFDIVTCLDVIEHLTKENGEKWLDHFEEIANNLIIIFTPDGFLPQGPEQDPKFDEWERHLSGWEAEDFLKRGYCVWRTPKDFHHNPTGVIGDWSALLAWKNKAI